MTESVYKVIELVGTSTKSWEKAAEAAVNRTAESLRELRVAEISAQDLVIENGRVSAYRAKVKVSFNMRGKRLNPVLRRHLVGYERVSRAEINSRC